MKYRSEFLANSGVTSTAVLEAPDEQSLHEQLHREGCTLLRATPVQEAAVATDRVRFSTKQQLSFAQSLHAALDAGVPLLAVLHAMAEQEEDPKVAAMLEGLSASIASGQTLADALSGYPRAFPPVFCSMVRAGEQSGTLTDVFHSLVDYFEWRLSIQGTVRTATTYPLVLGAAGYALVVFLLAFVIPKLGALLGKMGSDLPASSRFLIQASTMVADRLPEVVLGTVVAIVAVIALLRTEFGRSAFATIGGRLPVVRSVLRTLSVAQLCRSLAVLLRSGLTMPHALTLSAAAIPQRGLRALVEGARERILGGTRITDALAEADVLPPVAMSMVRVGEDAGRLPEAFSHLGRVYDREVRETVRRALGLLEPAVTVLLGVVVGGVAAMVITTVYSAMRGLGK